MPLSGGSLGTKRTPGSMGGYEPLIHWGRIDSEKPRHSPGTLLPRRRALTVRRNPRCRRQEHILALNSVTTEECGSEVLRLELNRNIDRGPGMGCHPIPCRTPTSSDRVASPGSMNHHLMGHHLDPELSSLLQRPQHPLAGACPGLGCWYPGLSFLSTRRRRSGLVVLARSKSLLVRGHFLINPWVHQAIERFRPG